MKLKKYNDKRDFLATTEPIGKVKKSKSLRFVIQEHDASHLHYDFRLEHNGVLLSWAVPKGLSTNPKVKRLAVMVEDHPVDYIDFEGVIPKGNYGAGTVEIYDYGTYEAVDSISSGLKKGHIKVILHGEKVLGEWSLIHTEDNNWLIIKSKDEYANSTKKIANPFTTVKPQLATLTDSIPNTKDWLFEIKYDGYRIISFIDKTNITMRTRNNLDYTDKFPTISSALSKLNKTAVLDGEVVAFDSTGRSDFSLLRENIQSKKDCYYVIFDILAYNGIDLRKTPLIERKKILERILTKGSNNLIYSTHVIGSGKKIYSFAKKNNLEGIIAKKIDSKYSSERTEDWLKIKCYLRQEFVIAGYTTSTNNPNISSLLLGYFNKNKLIYVGKVGTGFSEKRKLELKSLFKKYESKINPFSNEIKEKNTTFLEPKLVGEIQYMELTKDGHLRQPSFIDLRTDKDALDVTLEVKNG